MMRIHLFDHPADARPSVLDASARESSRGARSVGRQGEHARGMRDGVGVGGDGAGDAWWC